MRTTLALAMTLSFAVPVAGERRGDPRRGVPHWSIDPAYEADAFTFVRIRYKSRGAWDRWATDYPESDLNFSYRLRQLTSLAVHPDPKVKSLADADLADYPFIYLIEPGDMELTSEEVAGLRRYLLAGGFLMVDDFWGDDEWKNLAEQMRRAFPDREPVELAADHPIFHIVYDLAEKPQVPSIYVAQAGRDRGVSWEGGDDGKEVHYRAILDDHGRVMALFCHNTDLGDGWEREGEDPWYFREFSEKKAYPMGVNVIVYAMTH